MAEDAMGLVNLQRLAGLAPNMHMHRHAYTCTHMHPCTQRHTHTHACAHTHAHTHHVHTTHTQPQRTCRRAEVRHVRPRRQPLAPAVRLRQHVTDAAL